MNILTIELEEWFHLLDFDSTRCSSQWDELPSRIEQNTERILSILESTHTNATFFTIGWIAQKYPKLLEQIAKKYEIGTHGYEHQLIWQQTPKQFKEDLHKSIDIIEQIVGKKVKYYRAPGFSLTKDNALWALEIIKSEGIEIDCSVFPAKHAHGGIIDFGNSVPSIIEFNGCQIRELPISIKNIFSRHLAFSGGGYFRLCPYWLIRKWSKELEDKYLISYIHPRDLDKNQPIIKGLPIQRKFRSYVGLKGATNKLVRYLNDFDFTDISNAIRLIDWDNAPIHKL